MKTEYRGIKGGKKKLFDIHHLKKNNIKSRGRKYLTEIYNY